MMNFSGLLASLSGAGAPSPMAGPSPPMASAPPPMPSPAVTPAMPMPRQTPPHGRDLADTLLQIAPMVLSMFAARKNPQHAAALIQGVLKGQDVARRQQDEGRAEDGQRQQAIAKFMQTVAVDAQQFDDPVEHQKYLDFSQQIGEQGFGLPPGALKNIAFPTHKIEQKKLAAAEKRLAVMDRDPHWATLRDSDPDKYEDLTISVPGIEKPMSVRAARRMVGTQVMDAEGRDLAPPAKAAKPEKTPDAGSLTSVTDRMIRSKQRQLGRPLTDDEAVTVELQAKKLHGQADDRPRVNVTVRGGGTADSDAELVAAIAKDPAMFNSMTLKTKERLAPKLAAAGFSEFGKPLSETAMGKLAETKGAIASLRDLRTTLQENEQFIGPVAGLAALNPYSDAQKAQAKINLVRQRVGKALEGGVLRKEDEEKYKKILSTLRDVPATAIAKVDNLIATLERDLATFETEQKRGGRNITPGAAAPKPGTAGQKIRGFEVTVIK